MIRPVITRRVSKTGTDSTEIQKATTPICGKLYATLDVLSTICNVNIVISMPIISVPLSPMNIFDFFPNTLCRKKGISAPAERAHITAIVPSCDAQKNTPNAMLAMMHNPDDSPSTPSIMLMALMMPHPANATSGNDR